MQAKHRFDAQSRAYVEFDPLHVAYVKVDHELQLEEAALVGHDCDLFRDRQRVQRQLQLFQAVAVCGPTIAKRAGAMPRCHRASPRAASPAATPAQLGRTL